ncbi:glycosyltransferase [Microbacterium terricola]|uniref:Glycosyl transferase n=1 Tax=Microbacterium terricola TaxID=344163 RepID=A0ABM8E3P4_9MICO|nr:glycosyltransferase [Microbacterium terricola]UYK39931.1 glycosyltransferase [Microbacterium terricola]BDV32390.1 glycosyl transferase [Microbacterium terricola]
MSTYLVCSTPAHGHVTPLLAVAAHLIAAGHRVVFLTSERYGDRVRAVGAEFAPLPAAADVDLDSVDAFPGRAGLTGPAALRFDMINLFLRPGPAQLDALQALIAKEKPAAVLVEPLFVGAALLVELPRAERPPVVALGIFPLGVKSRDTAPFGLGITPMRGVVGRARNALLGVFAERVVFGPVTKEADAIARRVLGRPLSRFFLDWHSGADALVQFTVAGFEYPRTDLSSTVRFVGPLPAAPSGVDVPEWWDDLADASAVVHVTQGTVANADYGQLIAPTIAGLAASDVLVVVSTGGRPLTDLPHPLPANVRAATYLPYDALLPQVDVYVTNGGYGGVQQALGHGIPVVVAGRTEDKVEVSARIGWRGVGVDLKTNQPSPAQVSTAVRRILAEAPYRDAARALAEEIAAAPGLAGLDAVLAELAGPTPIRPLTGHPVA